MTLKKMDMIVFTYIDKIYAVWGGNHLPKWDPYDAYDASPNGLSGKKEGFYFANWLMPFAIPFKIEGVNITPENYPYCLDQESELCNLCTFFDADKCPLLKNKVNFELSRNGFRVYKQLIYSPRGEYGYIFDIAHFELLSLGNPLHYQTLARILTNRYPWYEITNHKLHKVLKLNPIFFTEIDDGVYQAVLGVKRESNPPVDLLFWDLGE